MDGDSGSICLHGHIAVLASGTTQLLVKQRFTAGCDGILSNSEQFIFNLKFSLHDHRPESVELWLRIL
jgi:hypothetical protein